jgi:hypothetical protein
VCSSDLRFKGQTESDVFLHIEEALLTAENPRQKIVALEKNYFHRKKDIFFIPQPPSNENDMTTLEKVKKMICRMSNSKF